MCVCVCVFQSFPCHYKQHGSLCIKMAARKRKVSFVLVSVLLSDCPNDVSTLLTDEILEK